MSDTREKLIELCEDVILSCKSSLCDDCEHNGIDYPQCMGVHFADHLIANDVTFAEDNNVPSKWIPVTERLPEKECRCLVCNKDMGIDIAVYCITPTPRDFIGDEMVSGFCVPLYNTHGVCIEVNEIVTHWMPLPSVEGLTVEVSKNE